MSESNSSSSSGGGCGCGGCVMLIVFILLMWSVWFGLPVGDKTWNIDIFPPRIWEMQEMPEVPVEAPATEATTSEVEATAEPAAKATESDTEVAK
jgi:hypothetical protein